jgi:hypothetical protein
VVEKMKMLIEWGKYGLLDLFWVKFKPCSIVVQACSFCVLRKTIKKLLKTAWIFGLE